MTSAPMGEYETPPGPVEVGGGQVADPATGSTIDVTAKDQAAQVSQSAKESGKQVVSTAADEASNVADETRRQAKHLGQEVSNQAQQQAALQKDNAATGLHALGEELRSMARHGGQSSPVTDLAHQAADKLTDVASWLERRDPGSLLDEVRTYARRKPGTFLLGAAAAGILAGRLTRGAAEASQDGTDASDDRQLANGSNGLRSEAGTPVYVGGGAMPDTDGSTPIADLTSAETAANDYESAGRSL
jgi:vacuolar-type H+-ATPase subunit H